MSSISNIVTPQPGLISTNPFLSGLGNTTQSGTPLVGGSTLTMKPNTNSGLLSQSGGALGSLGSSINGTPTSTPVTSSINFSGLIPTANAQTTGAATGAGASASSPYQKNLSQYGLTSIPAGYSFNANGALVNGAGQAYSPPSSGNTSGSSQGGTLNNGVLPAGQNGLTQPGVGISPANANPYTASAPSFPGLVGALGTQSSAPTQAFTQAQNTAQQAAQSLINSAPAQNAAVQGASTNLQDLENNYANQQGIIGNSPIGLSEQGGEQGLLNAQYASKLNAAQTNLANTLQGNAQEQAAFTGAGSTANTESQAATGQQSAQISGLGAAAGLSQPSYLAPGQSPYSPTTGQYGTIAGTQGGANGLQSIGGIQGQIGVGQNVTQLNSQLGGAQVVGNNLSNLIQQNNINPSGLSVVNGALQFGANQLSNPQYQEFQGQINDFINSIAPILGGANGASTDYKTQLAGQVVNALGSGQSIQQVIQYFLGQAQQKIQGLSSGGGAGVGSGSGGNTFGSFSGGS